MDRGELCAQPYSMVLTQNEARWAWCLTDDAGALIASIGIVADGPRRGWVMGFPGPALVDGRQLLPLIRLWRILIAAGAFTELRAWVLVENRRAIQFAERFGLAYDCGPATAYSHGGRDLNLHLWRAKNERARQGAETGGSSGGGRKEGHSVGE
jgi:hypothetical protein